MSLAEGVFIFLFRLFGCAILVVTGTQIRYMSRTQLILLISTGVFLINFDRIIQMTRFIYGN